MSKILEAITNWLNREDKLRRLRNFGDVDELLEIAEMAGQLGMTADDFQEVVMKFAREPK